MKNLREARGMTQTDLAKALRSEGLPFHQQTIQRIESGERPVRLNEAHLIAGFFRVKPETMTESFVATDNHLLWEMERVINESVILVESVVESYDEWTDRVSSFFVQLEEVIDREGVYDFELLPYPAKVGLAFAKHLLATSRNIEEGYHGILQRYGDRQGETREDRWMVADPGVTVYDSMRELLRIFEHERLEELSRENAYSLHSNLRIYIDKNTRQAQGESNG
jgi:transcriptional regulator with XRE-family HTH domain